MKISTLITQLNALQTWRASSDDRIAAPGAPEPLPTHPVDAAVAILHSRGYTLNQQSAAAARDFTDEPVPMAPEPAAARAGLKISHVIAALQGISKEHGDPTCAEEMPPGFLAIRYMETAQVSEAPAVLGVVEGETVVLIRGQ